MDTTLRWVSYEELSSAVVADAAINSTTLFVEDTMDFAEKGGQIAHEGTEYGFDSCDAETGEVKLSSPLLAPVAEGDVVFIITATGTVAQEWTAQVEWALSEEPIEATIPVTLIPYFIPGDEQAGASVTVIKNARGDNEVASRPGEPPVLDGATVWNPYLARRATAANIPDGVWFTVTGWADTIASGLTVEADGSVTVDNPGFYVMDGSPAFAANSVAGQRSARFLINGNQAGYLSIPADASGATDVPVGARAVLTERDNVTFQVRQSSGATLAIVTGVGISPMSMYRVSV